MARTADVEAGRAYVTLYLRRTNYDRQVEDLNRDNQQMGRPSQAIASQTEMGGSFNLGQMLAKGAAFRAGGVALSKLVPIFRETTTAAASAATAVASVGTASAVTAPAVAATGTASAASVPAVAAAGTAAGGAAVGFGAMAAALAPILIPLAAVAVAAGALYVAVFKWEKLPVVFRLVLLATNPLILAIRALVLAFKSLKVAVSIALLPLRLAAAALTAPFRLAAAAIRAFRAAVLAIPRAIASTLVFMRRLVVAAGEMAVKVAKAAVRAAAALARVPGQLVRGTSAAIRGVGTSIAKVGAIGAGIAAAIVGPATLAARSWAAYGDKIREVQNSLLKFELTAEEASIIARVSDQTGESVERLARDMRDGTRDFSRWRNELQQSGMLMSGPGLSAALALSRAYYSLKSSIAGLKNAIGAALGPALTEGTEIITGLVRGVIRWVNMNRPLVVQVFKIASAVAFAAAGITALGGVIVSAGAALTPFTAALAMIAGGLAIVEIRTEAGRSIWAAYGDSVRRVYGVVVQYLGQMAAFAGKVIGGIKDALLAGDLAGAVDVMWAAARVAWSTALLEIDTLTAGTFSGILQSLAAERWAAVGEGAVNALQQAWLQGVDFLAGVWGRVVDAADAAWTRILEGFDAIIAKLKSGLLDMLSWAISNILRPLAVKLNDISETLGNKALGAVGQLAELEDKAREALEAEKGPDRQAESDARKAARQAASDDTHVARQQEIEALKRRQAELAGEAGAAAEQERTANQQALNAAIAAAKAARDAADANKLKDEDFAVSQDRQSIARFSGEALGLSVGRAMDPDRERTQLSREQLKELRRVANALDTTLREVLRLQQMGGFTAN